jgi:hypothetical protein
VSSAVAHVYAINDGQIQRPTALDHSTAHDFPLFVLFEEQLKGKHRALSPLEIRVLVFSHARVRPLTYREPMRFETMPSSKRKSRLPYSITSSARASSEAGTAIPSDFAALRLITNSNLVGCSTGRSDGFVPLKILPTYVAARRLKSGGFGP